MDVVTAFLAGTLTDKVFLKMPQYLWSTFGKYVKVLKSFYGLKQAAAAWYDLLKTFLIEIGLNPLPTDPSIFINKSKSVQVSIGVYVDYLLIAGGNESKILAIKDQLKSRFVMKDLGEARNMLGIRIRRKQNLLAIDQTKYALEIITEFLADNAAAYDTPMDTNALRSLHHEPGKPLADEKLYLRVLGKLQFLCNTRPDVAYAVGRCGSWSSKPCKNHVKALYRIIGYTTTTIEYGIVYGTEYQGVAGVQNIDSHGWKSIDYYTIDHNIEAFAGCFSGRDAGTFTDADGGVDPKDRKVIQGHLLMKNGGATCWKSGKIDFVTRSTTAAEYISVSNSPEMTLWATQIIAQLEGKPIQRNVPLPFCDNKGAVQLSKGIPNTSKIKHIDACYYQILDEVKKGNIMVYWVRGNDQLADGFTKPLPRVTFQEKRSRIGFKDLSQWDISRTGPFVFSAWPIEDMIDEDLCDVV